MKYSATRLEEAIGEQDMVVHDRALATALAQVGEQLDTRAGDVIYKEGDVMRGVFLVLRGTISLSLKRNVVQILHDKQEFGIWPLVFSDPTYQVTAIAVVPTLLFHVNEQAFAHIVETYPQVWKNLVRTQARRLMTQDRLFLPQNDPIKVFVGSSRESLSYARKLKHCFQEHGRRRRTKITVELWTDIFGNMKYPLETLTARLDDWDFAVLVWAPDDQTESRTRKAPAPRDNVVLEAGLSIGRLGRDRTFVLVPRAGVELKIPSDVKQISLMEYSDQNMRMVARRIRKEIERLGPRTRLRYGSHPTTGP